jgi:hypothetical protein
LLLLVGIGIALLGAAGLLKLPLLDAGGRSAGADDVMQSKMRRAMSAAPDDIARSARIIDTDANANTIVLRGGSNGFT